MLHSLCLHLLFIDQAIHLLKSLHISFHKIGYASAEKIEQALFSSLGLHYLCKMIFCRSGEN